MEKQLPNGWKSPKLDELIIFKLGGDWGKEPEFNDSDYVEVRCIRASELRNWSEEKGETAALRKIKKSSLAKRELQAGDILVEISGGGPEQPVGRTVLIDKSVLAKNAESKKVCTNFFRLIRPSCKVNAKYLNIFLQYFYASGKISEFQSGSNNLRNLKFNDYLQINVPLASEKEQESIVAKIEELFSELDSGIASLKTAQEQLKIYRQALLKHAFEGKLTEQWRKDNANKLETPEQLLARIQTERETRYQQQLDEWKQAVKDWEAKGKEGKKPAKPRKYKPAVLSDEVIESLPSIPNSWRWVSFSELLFSIRGGTTIPPIDMPTSLPILRSSSIRAAQLNLKDIRYLPEDSKISSEDYLKPSDLLFSRLNGTLEFVGVCASMPSIFPKNLLYPDRLYCATLIYPEMAKLYECYFSSPLVRQSIEKKAKSTAGHKRISIPDISEQPIPIFDNNEAKKIIDLLSEKLSIIEQNEKEIESALAKAELLRQSILKKAFNGQLVTSE